MDEFVVKPAIGAGSRDAQRFGPEEKDDAAEHAQRMLNEKRSVLLQPYLSRVDEYGETALIYFEGQFSHAIRKGPLLKRKEGPTKELFAKESITARVPDAAELRVGARAMQAMPFETPLYARVDLIRDQKGEPVVLELELIEPSLFFPFAVGVRRGLRRPSSVARILRVRVAALRRSETSRTHARCRDRICPSEYRCRPRPRRRHHRRTRATGCRRPRT